MESDKWRSRLKRLAKHKGITNEDIAHHFDITPGQVSHWFTGRRGIWLSEFIELCRFLMEDPARTLVGESLPPNHTTQIVDQQTQIIDRLDRILEAKPENLPDHKVLMKKMRKAVRSRQPATKRVKKSRTKATP